MGIAMGAGTDVALETANASLIHNRVLDVSRLIGVTGLWLAIPSDTCATVLVTLNALRSLRWRQAG